jgi:hypothetical protein
MAAYEYRLSAVPLAGSERGWVVKIWVREFSEDPDQTGWRCVYEQAKKYKTDGRFPSKYWQWIVKSTLA